MNLVEILQRVKDSILKLHKFEAELGSASECISYYYKHGQDNNDGTKGPQCACPSPTIPFSVRETSQTSLNYLSEFPSSAYTSSYSFPTSALAEDMSASYPEKSTQGLDSTVTFTDVPSDLTPLTTIVNHSYSDTTEQSGDYADYPHTPPDFPVNSTEFPNDIQDPSNVTLHPSQTRTHPVQVTKEASNSGTEGMYESVVPPTIENPILPTSSHMKREFSTFMEPDEIQETTMSDISSHSSIGDVLQDSESMPSKEPGTETSSSSVTKIRRSLVNMDTFTKSDSSTHAVSGLFSGSNDPNAPLHNSVHTNIPYSGIGLSHPEAPEPTSQGRVIEDNNLGWASSYLSSTILTTKAEHSVFTPGPGGHFPLSDATNKPLISVHKSYNILPQQESNLAIHDRENSVSGPNYGSNMLPIIATEKSEDRTKNEHNQSNLQLLIVVPLVVLVLLFLCGFLYYRYQYRKLRRRLTMSCDQDLTINHIAESPEERVHLQIECDVV
ncbi:hypothetical protein GDO81_029945 [Engystomops pustulosus]|uniref:Uncharacterized protein n=1 Tax=Engystomops pustulosus TaxID=76066 RepID=A0AAV6Z3W7_ENGPU|nr:hypothetical protein GDO81_029945 [Engystomops pustulosus]